jgi:inorganic pyrophosphatase
VSRPGTKPTARRNNRGNGRGPVPQFLLRLTPFNEDGNLLVVIETPKGSHTKYDFDPAYGHLKLAKVLPEGMVFPFSFGFIPSTVAGDGDPLDVLVLLESSVPPLCIVETRLVGAIQARQKEAGGEWIENDRLIAVAAHSHEHDYTGSLADLRPHRLDEIKAFFADYNKLEGRKFEALGDLGPKQAAKRVKAGMRAFKKKGR